MQTKMSPIQSITLKSQTCMQSIRLVIQIA